MVGPPNAAGLLDDFKIVIDGVVSPVLTKADSVSDPITPPKTSFSSPTLDLTFGSWGNHAPGQGSDADNLNGGLRDWTAGLGVPTLDELARYRNNENPTSIWSVSRVLGYWHFDTLPTLDASGNGHALVYSDVGTVPGHSLPVLVTV